MEGKNKQNKLTQTRQELVNMFLEVLNSSEPLSWTKGWVSSCPKNAITNKEYRGINRMMLTIQSMYKGYSDPRWCTFKQAQEKGYSIKKGEKSSLIEFWSYYDKEKKKAISFEDVARIMEDDIEYYKENISLMSRTYRVFNAEQINGIPELEKRNDLELPDELEKFVDNIKSEMNIPIIYGGNEAYYNILSDEVHMPEKNKFSGINEYYSTVLHELGHSTGSSKRLNRDLTGAFGTEAYAKEELRAEIASCFLASDIGFNSEKNDEHNRNHVAYIQSWIKIIEDKPMELMTAIKDAEVITTYLKEKGKYAEIFEQKTMDNLEIEKAEENTPYKYAILQLSENSNSYNPNKFIDLENLRKKGNEPNGDNYEIIYLEDTNNMPKLEEIYLKFNSGAKPENYYGTSVSISDVIILCDNKNNDMKAYYCDRIGFSQLEKSFLTERIMTNIQKNMDIRNEYKYLSNRNLANTISEKELERFTFIDKEYSSIFEMASKRSEDVKHQKTELPPFSDVKLYFYYVTSPSSFSFGKLPRNDNLMCEKYPEVRHDKVLGDIYGEISYGRQLSDSEIKKYGLIAKNENNDMKAKNRIKALKSQSR